MQSSIFTVPSMRTSASNVSLHKLERTPGSMTTSLKTVICIDAKSSYDNANGPGVAMTDKENTIDMIIAKQTAKKCQPYANDGGGAGSVVAYPSSCDAIGPTDKPTPWVHWPYAGLRAAI